LNSFIIWCFSYSGSNWTIQCPYRSWGTNVSKWLKLNLFCCSREFNMHTVLNILVVTDVIKTCQLRTNTVRNSLVLKTDRKIFKPRRENI
jgi:hypothetical protein